MLGYLTAAPTSKGRCNSEIWRYALRLHTGDTRMTEEQFERDYPKEQYNYVRTNFRTKGSHGQTEIESFDIVSKATGETVLQATRTEHTNLRGLDTTVNWDW